MTRSYERMPMPIMPNLAFGKGFEIASPEVVKQIGDDIAELTEGLSSMPLTLEAMLLDDHPELTVPESTDLTSVVGSTFSPETTYDEVVKLVHYDELGRSLLVDSQRAPSGVTDELKLVKALDNSKFQATFSVTSSGELLMSGQCQKKYHSRTPDLAMAEFVNVWGLSEIWRGYTVMAKGNRPGSFDFPASAKLAEVVALQLANIKTVAGADYKQ